jgi:hypothetical protein
MVDRKVVPFDEFYYQLKLMYLFQKHPVFNKFKFWLIGCYYKKAVMKIRVVMKMRAVMKFLSRTKWRGISVIYPIP